MLNALHDLTSAIFQLYQNGSKLEFDGRNYGYAARIEDIKSNVRRALSSVRREA